MAVDNISTEEEGDSDIIDDSDYVNSTTTQRSGQSQTMPSSLDAPNSPISPSSIAPDPPQWRFVRKAKKTEGYSSDYAGSYVKGLSAEELVGKHTPLGRVSQQINQIEQSIDNDNNSTNNIDLEEEDSTDVEKNVPIGKLNVVISGNEIDTRKNEKDIGKLHIEGEHTFEESFEGSVRYKKRKVEDVSNDLDVGDAVKEIDIQDKEVVVDTRTSEHITDNDTTIEDTEEDNNAITAATVEVVSYYTADYDLGQMENQTNTRETPSILATVINQSAEEERAKPPTTRVVCFLVILISVIAAVVLGIVFGSSSDKNDNSEQINFNLSGVGADEPVPSLMPSYSIPPSGNDSKVIPLSTKQPSSVPITNQPSIGPTSIGPSFSVAPSNEPSSQPSLQPSSQLSSQPSSQPTLTAIPNNSEQPTTTRSPVEPSYTLSQQPSASTNPTRSTTQTFLLRELAFPSDNLAIPCLESIEAEMAGRLYGITGSFCGFCQWKRSSFNCYQRVSFLFRHYKVPQLTARQNLLNRDQCTVPDDGIGAGIQAMIDRQSYCGDVDTVGVTTSVDTIVTISEPI